MTKQQQQQKLEKLMKKLTEEELKRVRQLITPEASKCDNFSCGSLTLCAILCRDMACGDFEHTCRVNIGCVTLIKCRGFKGDGGDCKPFVIVEGPAG